MDFYKKLRARRPSEENIVDILSEVERKFEDMQPVIQDQDGSKVQKTIAEIRAHVDYLKNFGGTVTDDQQDRMKEINRRFKEITTKYSDPNGSVPKSPRVFRRRMPEPGKEPPPVPQNKVALVEVEEKLKLMRQRRLDRLSVFVEQQSKLSEERSNIKSPNESSEIEKAIKSIQKTEIEKKIILKPVIEENRPVKEDVESNVKKSPKLGRNRSNESTDKFKNGKSSTMKFINKLNCTLPTNSSTEDLTKDTYDIRIVTKLEDKYISQKPDYVPKENQAAVDNTDCNPLLSPIGKQRKAVYLYDHECTFLEKEKRTSLPLSTFGKEVHQDQEAKKPEPKPKIQLYENADIIVKNSSVAVPVEVLAGKTFGKVNDKKVHLYENREIIGKVLLKPPPLVKPNELQSDVKSKEAESKPKEVIVDKTNRSVAETREKENREPVGRNETDRHSAKLDEQKKSEEEGKRKSSELRNLPKLSMSKMSYRKANRNVYDPPKTPLPIPRRNHAERILKKMQRNWDSLDEILANDSDVDGDEIEDLKKTWEEASALLSEYKTKVKKLDKKSNEEIRERLRNIESQVNVMEESIKKFKGLKRDCSYKQMSSRLSNYFLEVNKMSCSSDETINGKKDVLGHIDRCIKVLENKVAKNEALLIEVLDAQVRSIGTNCLSITKV